MSRELKALIGLVVGVVVLAATIAVFAAIEDAEKRARAEAAEARADSLEAVAGSLEAVSDSLSHRSDSALAVLDSVHREQSMLRDSLQQLRRSVEMHVEEVEVDLDSASLALDRQLMSILRSARPGLKPAVHRAIAMKDTLMGNVDRFREGMRRSVELLAQENRSLRDELGDTRHTVSLLTEDRDSLQSVVREKNSTIAAKNATIDRYKELAFTPWWETAFGDGIVQATGVVASGVGAWLWDPKVGAGWTLAKGTDFTVKRLLD